jgi:aspartyl-tRNA(Asn)/glutamyl-tRNA(Gln) amidotransferase subunit A
VLPELATTGYTFQRLNPQLNGFSSIDEAGALASADRVDEELCSGRDRGLLHGIPVAIKDIIDVAGQKTTSGSALYVDRYAEKDAEVVRLLREAGAIIIGKTVLLAILTAVHFGLAGSLLEPSVQLIRK